MKRRLVISVLLVLVVILIGGMARLTNAAACPNAVSVAKDYMVDEYGMGPGSEQWGTIVSSVARESGRQGEFPTAEACEPGFAASVIYFVEGQFVR